jgi:predicted alpha/beta hydrolase
MSKTTTLPPLVTLTAADGFPLMARVYAPSTAARATLLVCSATAAPQTYYGPFALAAARAGFRVITYDYRGVGASRGRSLRGMSATLTDWARLDAARAIDFARSFGDRVVHVGHSFGAQILGLTDAARRADAAILVGGQFGFYGHWPILRRPRMLATWRAIIPSATRVFGYLPKELGLGEDLPRGVAREWARWCTTPEYLLRDHPDALARFAAFDKPVLAYSFTDDEFAPPRAVDAFVRCLSSAKVDHRHLRPADAGVRKMGHFGFFRPAQGGALWEEALAFAA